jgi:hypothetical protein
MRNDGVKKTLFSLHYRYVLKISDKKYQENFFIEKI